MAMVSVSWRESGADTAAGARLAPVLSAKEFEKFRGWIYEVAGISLSPAKQALVAGRLAKRLRERGLTSYDSYFRLLDQDAEEFQQALDLLTTNETYFFREPGHFDFLQQVILPAHDARHPFRIWSAASSSGEEVYTLAMVLAESLGDGAWEVFGSDISSRVLEKARQGTYELSRAKGLPDAYLKRYCLRGVRSQAGRFRVAPGLRERVRFAQINLNAQLPRTGSFDAIFLRNVMIYFNQETKRRLLQRLVERLQPGGYLFVGHSESVSGLASGLEMVRPSIYRRT